MRHAPVAPRMLNKSQAATYCGLAVATFGRLCPVRSCAMGADTRLHRFDVKLLDLWLDSFMPGDALSVDDIWIERMEREAAMGDASV